MYTFDKSKCTEGFAGMIHAWAIVAALTNRHPMSLIPEANGERDSAERNNPRLTEYQIRNSHTVECTFCGETILEDAAEWRDDAPHCSTCHSIATGGRA
jgi:hypothetical protein